VINIADTFSLTQQPDAANEVFYIDGDITTDFENASSGSVHYTLLDDIWHSPTYNDYVYTTSLSTTSEEFSLEAYTTSTGSISYIRVSARLKALYETTRPSFLIYISDGTNESEGSKQILTKTYALYYETFVSTPSGGSWTLPQLNSLRIGVKAFIPKDEMVFLNKTDDCQNSYFMCSDGLINGFVFTGTTTTTNAYQTTFNNISNNMSFTNIYSHSNGSGGQFLFALNCYYDSSNVSWYVIAPGSIEGGGSNRSSHARLLKFNGTSIIGTDISFPTGTVMFPRGCWIDDTYFYLPWVRQQSGTDGHGWLQVRAYTYDYTTYSSVSYVQLFNDTANRTPLYATDNNKGATPMCGRDGSGTLKHIFLGYTETDGMSACSFVAFTMDTATNCLRKQDDYKTGTDKWQMEAMDCDDDYIYTLSNDTTGDAIRLWAFSFDGTTITSAGSLTISNSAKTGYDVKVYDSDNIYVTRTDGYLYKYSFDGSTFTLVSTYNEGNTLREMALTDTFLTAGGDLSGDYTTVTMGKPGVWLAQIFAVSNYTPNSSLVNLTMPDRLSVSHSRNIERFLFAQGDYEIIDVGRGGKQLNISGIETTSTVSDMQSLKDMCHYGNTITIAGLPDTNLNTDYLITSFSWEDMSYNSNTNDRTYRWNLSLEEA